MSIIEKKAKELKEKKKLIPHYELNNEIDKLKGITYFHPDMINQAKHILESINELKPRHKGIVKIESINFVKKFIDKNKDRPADQTSQTDFLVEQQIIVEKEKTLRDILTSPDLLDMLIKELDKVIMGERDTKHFLLLSFANIWVANSKKRPHILVKSGSSAGKSYIVKKVLELFPQDLWVYKSRITETALTYIGANKPDFNWDGKILYLEDVEEKVLNSPSHKVFLSEGSEDSSIVLKAGFVVDFKVKGKPLEVCTTAEAEAKIELINRYNQISLDESKEQTINVNMLTAEVYKSGQEIKYSPLITDALKGLKRLPVKVPYSDKLASLFPVSNMKARRDFPRFLELIMCCASLHQYQRKKDEQGFILATGEDYEQARLGLSKIHFSESLMTMTPTEKEMLQTCEDLTNKSIAISQETGQEIIRGFTTQDVITAHPDASQSLWYRKLKEWSSKKFGLLSVELFSVDGVKQKVKHYRKTGEFVALNLPPFKQVIDEV